MNNQRTIFRRIPGTKRVSIRATDTKNPRAQAPALATNQEVAGSSPAGRATHHPTKRLSEIRHQQLVGKDLLSDVCAR